MPKIAVYTHLHRLTNSILTGVGKHIYNMARGLYAAEGDRMVLWAAREQLDNTGKIPSNNPLAGLPVRGYSGSRRLMEKLWAYGLGARAERWVGDCEWLYFPAETYVPVRRINVVTTCHCVNWFEPNLPWYHQADTARARRRMGRQFRKMFERSDVIMPVSEFLKERIAELFDVDPARMQVVGNGVEREYFEIAETSAILSSRERPYLLVVGGLTQRKGADATMNLARLLREKLPDLQLLVAGASEARYAQAAAAHPNIVSIGYKGLAELPTLMRQSVAVLFLSIYETFGIPAAEAMAAGTPVIVSNLGALPEIVGAAGIIADLGDPGQTVAQIERLMSDGAYRANVIARGRQRAQRFTWEACVERVRQVINR